MRTLKALVMVWAMMVGLAILGADPCVAGDIDWSEVRLRIEKGKWKKGFKALDEIVRKEIRTVGFGRGMSEADLVAAVRYRALLEAGGGRQQNAAYWWHAGLQLDSEGASELLAWAPDKVAAKLKDLQLRPPESPPRSSLTQVSGQENPSRSAPAKASTLFSLADLHLDGHVILELWLGNPQVERPLISEVTTDRVGIYVALDHTVLLYVPQQNRARMGNTKYLMVLFGRR